VSRPTRLLVLATLVLLVTDAAAVRRRAVTPRRPAPAPAAVHYRGGPERSGQIAAHGPRAFTRVAWQVPLPSISFTPFVFANGSAYVVDGGGRLTSIDAGTGTVRWTTGKLGDIVVAPTITESSVFVGTNALGVLELRLADGVQIRSFGADAEVFASPLVDGGTLFVFTEAASVYAYDLGTGAEKWHVKGDAPIHAHPAKLNDMVVFSSGGMIALDAATGARRWKFDLGGEFVSGYSVAGGVVYIAGATNLYAIDASGHQLWKTAIDSGGGFANPAVADGMMIVASVSRKLLAINASSGTIAWQRDLGDLMVDPVVANGVIYGGLATLQSPNANLVRRLFAIDILNGATLSTFDLTGHAASAAGVTDGRVFHLTSAARLYALE
jgi:outer membrane protein assembly factor BamB